MIFERSYNVVYPAVNVLPEGTYLTYIVYVYIHIHVCVYRKYVYMLCIPTATNYLHVASSNIAFITLIVIPVRDITDVSKSYTCVYVVVVHVCVRKSLRKGHYLEVHNACTITNTK